MRPSTCCVCWPVWPARQASFQAAFWPLGSGRLGARPALVLGLYYGGTGLGIVLSALLVPPLAWPAAWWALAGAAAVCTGVMAIGTRTLGAMSSSAAPPGEPVFRAQDFVWALAGYLMFGLGYIGYMTFSVTLLRTQGMGTGAVVAFYILLGLGVVASSWLWAPLLHRARGGAALALLNALLALAALLPVMSHAPADLATVPTALHLDWILLHLHPLAQGSSLAIAWTLIGAFLLLRAL